MASTALVLEEADGAVVHTLFDIDPDEPENMSVLLAVDRTQASPQSVCSNDVAYENM